MATGTIKRLTDRGFGFIKRSDSGKDVFFFHKNLVNARFDELREGLPVTFDVEEGDRGPKAVNVNVTR